MRSSGKYRFYHFSKSNGIVSKTKFKRNRKQRMKSWKISWKCIILIEAFVPSCLLWSLQSSAFRISDDVHSSQNASVNSNFVFVCGTMLSD